MLYLLQNISRKIKNSFHVSIAAFKNDTIKSFSIQLKDEQIKEQ